MGKPSLRKSVVLGAWMSLAGLLGGCGPSPEPGEGQELVQRAQPLTSGGEVEAYPGLSLNGLGLKGLVIHGLSANGLSANGLSPNGLSLNGLSLNGLGAASFSEWFNAYPARDTDMLMRYLVRCAVPTGESRTWTNPMTQQSYLWHGLLGLAPGWSSGQPATEEEQQVITACLAAHANKYGAHVRISLQGEAAQGVPIPVQEGELATYSQEEGAFFGNLFQGEGIFACQSPSYVLPPLESTWRACALVSREGQAACPPIQVLGRCTGALKCERDSTRTSFRSCRHEGKTYRALTIRLNPELMNSLSPPSAEVESSDEEDFSSQPL